MARLLVTGGAGFLGSYLCERLLDLNHHVTAFDMSSGEKVAPLIQHPRFRFVQDSILNVLALRREIDRVDVVVHFAAIADPKRYVTEPLTTLRIDLQGTLHVFQCVAERGAKLVFASTSEVYGRNPDVPWKEDADRVLGSTQINRWCYATSKAAGEHYCYAYHQQEGLRFVIFRFFNVYGPRLDDLGSGRVLPIFLNQCLQGNPMTIHGDGLQTRSFVYVEDAVDCVVRGIFNEAAEGQAFNVGSKREVSMTELAEILKRVGRFSSEIVYVPHREFFGPSYEDIPRRVPDVSKAKDVLGWEANMPLEEGLQRTIDYYRERLRTLELPMPTGPGSDWDELRLLRLGMESPPWPGGQGGNVATLTQRITVKALDWDTRHFGIRMGQLLIPIEVGMEHEEALTTAIRTIVVDAATQGYKQLVARAIPNQTSVVHALENCGFRLVSTMIILEVKFHAAPHVNALHPDVSIRQGRATDANAMMEIAREAFANRAIWMDRFHADPRIPHAQADDVYAQWAKNSIAPDHPSDRMADATLVAEVGGRVVGFITCRIAQEGGETLGIVPLNAVDTSYRQRGIYRSLVEAALHWLYSQGCKGVRIRTSIASHGVRRTWHRFGTIPVADEHAFHWWAS